MTEPSVLAYARHFDLTRDHHEEDLWQHLQYLFPPTFRPLDIDLDEEYARLSPLFDPVAGKDVSLTGDVDREPPEVVNYLQEATKGGQPDIEKIYRTLLPDHHRKEKYKIQIPLLLIAGGDVDKDVRRIRRGIDLARALDDVLDEYKHLSHPSYQAKKQSGGVTLDRVCEILNPLLKQAMKPQAMSVSRTVVTFISQALSTDVDDARRLSIINRHLPNLQRNLTLSPIPINETDFDIIDAGHEFPPRDLPLVTKPMQNLVSSPSTTHAALPIDNELLSYLDTAVDQEIILSSETSTTQGACEPVSTNIALADAEPESQQDFVINTPESLHSPLRKRRKLTHSPLTLDEIQFSNAFEESSPEDIPEPHHLRVSVPHLDFVVTELPNVNENSLIKTWCRSGTSQRHTAETWTFDLDLPFKVPSIQDIFQPELSDKPSIVDKVLGKEKEVLCSDQVLWKEPGINLLRCSHEDYEELHESDFVLEQDGNGYPGAANEQKQESPELFSSPVSFIVEIRKNEPKMTDKYNTLCNIGVCHDLPQSRAAGPISTSTTDLIGTSEDKDCQLKSRLLGLPLKKHDDHLSQETCPEKGNDICGSAGSDSLANFMELREKQFKPLMQKPLLSKHNLEVDNDPIQCSQFSMSDARSEARAKNDMKSHSLGEVDILQHFIPEREPCERFSIVLLNNSLLQHKPLLVQFLERQVSETFSVIYRELDTATKGPDLILNTTTCLFIVSLQLLSQRSLPGQPSRTGLSPAHDQIYAALNCYDRIFVLVLFNVEYCSANAKLHASQSEFISFCDNMTRQEGDSDTTIVPIWLPCIKASSTSELVNVWVWRIVRQQSYSPREHVQGALIDDVTLWELLLVKAGLNPMSAQVVIGLLKKPRSGDMTRSGGNISWGLRMLMTMSAQERHGLFDDAIGRRAVSRLCKAVSR